MKRYLPILSVVALFILVPVATSLGYYDPLVNSLGIEPETDEHPWGGDGVFINNGGNNGGTYIFTPTPFFFVDLSRAFDFIIILGGDIGSKPLDDKITDSMLPSNAGNATTGSTVAGKGN